jgi:hypothetical protein
MWPLSIAPKNDSYFTGDNPQFCLIADCLNTSTNQANVQFTQTIWILLSRHLKDRTTSKSKGIVKLSIEIDFDRELNSFYIAASGEEEGGVNFLALHIHWLVYMFIDMFLIYSYPLMTFLMMGLIAYVCLDVYMVIQQNPFRECIVMVYTL